MICLLAVVTFGDVKSYYGYLGINNCYILICQVSMGIMVAKVTQGFIWMEVIIWYGKY